MPSETKTLTYSEKLRDPRWQKMRLKIMDRDQFTCQSCFSQTKTLNVHHEKYATGRDPWEYPVEQLVTLCESCHKGEHVTAIKTEPAPFRNPPKRGSDIMGWRARRPIMLLQLERLKEMVALLESSSTGHEQIKGVVEIVTQMEFERDTVKEDTTTLQDFINGTGEAIH